RDIPTDEHPFWFTAASRHPYAPEKGTAHRDDRPGARSPAGVATRGGRMIYVYLAAFQTYLEVERQASPHTIRNYLSDLDQFVGFASDRLGPLAQREGPYGPAPTQSRQGLRPKSGHTDDPISTPTQSRQRAGGEGNEMAALTPAQIDAT